MDMVCDTNEGVVKNKYTWYVTPRVYNTMIGNALIKSGLQPSVHVADGR